MTPMFAIDFMIAYLYFGRIVSVVMSYACSTCDAEFESAGGVTQHVALHHNTCAMCDESFDDVDSLRDHIHSAH